MRRHPGRRCPRDLTVLIRNEQVPVLEETRVAFRHYGEGFDTLVVSSARRQHYSEDCPICCSPIEFEVQVDGEGNLLTLMTRRDDD